ncbi:MAG TPA: hypothetical protein VJN70_17275 [Gemmatimonadaceae bacterium]|nr:hypothetical protein [Gemmatimonadaceae bacterium]
MKSMRHLPVLGIAIGLGISVLATMRYPGGTLNSADTVGYNRSQNYISSLFAPQALDGEPNRLRQCDLRQ